MICPYCREPADESLTRMGLSLHPTCPSLDVDPDLVAAEVFTIVKDAIVNAPRSQQTTIGPSEMGHPCTRRIGYKLAGTVPLNTSQNSVAWKPAVGTMMHSALADIMAQHEIDTFPASGLTPRWRVEERVTVGEIGGVKVTGQCDLFDAHGGVVIDWKTTSRDQMRRKFAAEGPGEQYRTQAHLYGLGWENAGHPVRHVMLIWLVRDGNFTTDRLVWSEPYDRQVALDALDRVATVRAALDARGPEIVLPMLPATEAYCNNCPFYRRGEDDLALACPGVNQPADALEELFA